MDAPRPGTQHRESLDPETPARPRSGNVPLLVERVRPGDPGRHLHAEHLHIQGVPVHLRVGLHQLVLQTHAFHHQPG